MSWFPKYELKPIYKPFVQVIDFLGSIMFSPFKPKEKIINSDIKSILLIRLDNMGDVLTTTPAIRAIKKGFPNSKIDILIRPATKDLIKNHPAIDKVIEFDSPWLHRSGALNILESFKAFKSNPIISQLRQKHYDLAIEFHTDPRNLLLTYIIGAKRRLGHDVRGLGFLLTDVVPYKKGNHIIERNLLLPEYLDCKAKDKHTDLFLDKPSFTQADRWIEKNIRGQFICINPCTGRPNKFWLDQRWAQVADQLIEKLGITVVFTGAKQDTDRINNIISQMKNRSSAKVAAGSLSLLASAALFKRSKLLLATDTGPLHIAKAMRTPIIGLFGPVDPKEWGYDDKTSITIDKFKDCKCKYLPDCVQEDKYLCMRGISVQEVVEAALKLWKKN